MRFYLALCFVSVWLTFLREGRKCADKRAQLSLAWGSIPVKNKPCLQVWWIYLPGFCSWSQWLRQSVCFWYLFLCNYRPANLKGALHAGRRNVFGFSREFILTHSFPHVLPVLTVCLCLYIALLVVLAYLIVTIIFSWWFRFCLKLLFYSTVDSNFYPL